MKSPRRWTSLSRSTRHRIDKLVELMRARDQIRRRMSRAWILVRIRKDGDA